jgi:hypothetical protein
MPKIKRWFPVSHDFLDDPDVYEMRKKFGDRSVFFWLRLLSWGDKNEGEIKGSQAQVAREFGRTYDPAHPNRAATQAALTLEWMAGKRWVEIRSASIYICNYVKYHRTREQYKSRTGTNEVLSEPSEPNLTLKDQSSSSTTPATSSDSTSSDADPSGSGSFKNKSSDSEAASPDSDNGSEDEIWKPAVRRIYNTDPTRFARLMVWVNATKRLSYPDTVIQHALERFEEFDRGTKVEDWWPYVQKILKKEYARYQESEHETRKSAERKSVMRAIASGPPSKSALDMSDKERANTLVRLRTLREGIGRRMN